MTRIPFAKISIPPNTAILCAEIIESGNISNLDHTNKFEEKVAKISGTDYAVCTNSGTTALNILSRHVLTGKVGVQDYTWISTKKAVTQNGFAPVYLDVDKNTWLVKKKQLAATDSYLLTDTFGNKVSVTTKKPTIIDCAHSFGLPFNSKYDAGIYSFAPAKTFSCGEGGAIVTNNKKLYGAIKEEVKWAGRMQEANAYIGLDMARRYKRTLAQKKRIFNYYKKKLDSWLTFQEIRQSNYNVVGALAKDSTMLLGNLGDKIELKKRYSIRSRLPNSIALYRDNICLPSYPSVDYEMVTSLVREELEE